MFNRKNKNDNTITTLIDHLALIKEEERQVRALLGEIEKMKGEELSDLLKTYHPKYSGLNSIAMLDTSERMIVLNFWDTNVPWTMRLTTSSVDIPIDVVESGEEEDYIAKLPLSMICLKESQKEILTKLFGERERLPKRNSVRERIPLLGLENEDVGRHLQSLPREYGWLIDMVEYEGSSIGRYLEPAHRERFNNYCITHVEKIVFYTYLSEIGDVEIMLCKVIGQEELKILEFTSTTLFARATLTQSLDSLRHDYNLPQEIVDSYKARMEEKIKGIEESVTPTF